jgi:hypothetical protein
MLFLLVVLIGLSLSSPIAFGLILVGSIGAALAYSCNKEKLGDAVYSTSYFGSFMVSLFSF